MEFNTLIESLNKLKEQLQLKKEAIIKKELEKLNNADEEIKAISEFLIKNNYVETAKSCSNEEKKRN